MKRDGKLGGVILRPALPVPACMRILPGHYYSNGAYGRAWGVRLVLDFSLDDETGEETLRFRGMAGVCRRKTGQCTLDEFLGWARHEVALNENSWQRVGDTAPGDTPP